MAELELISTVYSEETQLSYVSGMVNYQLINMAEYKETSEAIAKQLKIQNTFANRIFDSIRYGHRVKRVLRHVRNTCFNPNDIARTMSDFTVQNIFINYMHMKSPLIKREVQICIESYNICNEVIRNPYREYSEDFIKNMIDKSPTYKWDNKIRNALLSLDTNLPSYRIETIKEYRDLCMFKIKYSPYYILFNNAVSLKQGSIRDLILLFIKTRDEILKKKHTN